MQIQAFVLGLSNADRLTNDHLVCVCVCVYTHLCMCVCLLLSRPCRQAYCCSSNRRRWMRTHHMASVCFSHNRCVCAHVGVCSSTSPMLLQYGGVWRGRAARCLPPCCFICRLISREEDKICRTDFFFCGTGIRRSNLPVMK